MTSSLSTEQLRAKLNAESVLPGIAYRRNFARYELVCYVNCLVGAELSGRDDVIDLFVDRIKSYMDKNGPGPEFERYYDLIRDYMASIARE